MAAPPAAAGAAGAAGAGAPPGRGGAAPAEDPAAEGAGRAGATADESPQGEQLFGTPRSEALLGGPSRAPQLARGPVLPACACGAPPQQVSPSPPPGSPSPEAAGGCPRTPPCRKAAVSSIMDLSPDVTCVSLEARLLSAELSPSECWLVPADDAQCPTTVLPPPAPTPTLQLGARAGPPEAAVRSQAPAVRLVGAPPLAGALGDQPVDQSIEASPPPATPVRTCATDGGAAGSPLWRPAAVRSPAMPW
ncbi:unnamed protein product, partial [Prorocentrum cordatum]